MYLLISQLWNVSFFTVKLAEDQIQGDLYWIVSGGVWYPLSLLFDLFNPGVLRQHPSLWYTASCIIMES